MRRALTQAECAYIAGFIDGDGCVHLQKRKDTRSGTLYLRVQVTNTEWAIVDWLHDRLGGIRKRGLRRSATNRALHQWMLCGNAAAQLLLDIQPFLVLKVEQANLGIFAWETRSPQPRTLRRYGKVPDEVLARRTSNVAAMRELNRKGRYEAGEAML